MSPASERLNLNILSQVDGRKANMVRWMNRLSASTNTYFVLFRSKTQSLSNVQEKQENQPELYYTLAAPPFTFFEDSSVLCVLASVVSPVIRGEVVVRVLKQLKCS